MVSREGRRFAALYAQQWGRVLRILLAGGVSEADADDHAQAVFLALWAHWPEVRPEAVARWLEVASLRQAANWRKLGRNRVLHERDETDHVASETPDPEALLAVAEACARLDALSPVLCAALRLADEGHSPAVIGARLGMSRTSAEKLINRLRAAYRTGGAWLPVPDPSRCRAYRYFATE